MYALPLSLHVEPGLVGVRLLVCRKEWSNGEFDARRFALRSGDVEYAALSLRTPLEPWVPLTVRLEFPVPHVGGTLALKHNRGLLARPEWFPLHAASTAVADEETAVRALESECEAAWLARAAELDAEFRPNAWRRGEGLLNDAVRLVERYLHAHAGDARAAALRECLRLKKGLVRALRAGDWLQAERLNDAILRLQPDWQGPRPDADQALDDAERALRAGLLEVAEARLRDAYAAGVRRAEAALLLARIHAAWGRDRGAAADWYLRYFEEGGVWEGVADETASVIDSLGDAGHAARGRLLTLLGERLIDSPGEAELIALVHELAETQSAGGFDVTEDFLLLWAGYERSFEHQIAVDRRVDRTIVGRLERLHARLGNTGDWIRVRRQLADFEPARESHRVELARLLRTAGRAEAETAAWMALVLSSPLEIAWLDELASAAARADLERLALRAGVLAAWLRGAEGPEEPPPSRSVPVRLVVHPEIRPLLPALAPGRGAQSEAAVVMRTVELLTEPPDEEGWKRLQQFAARLELVPALDSAFAVSSRRAPEPVEPLAVAATVSLDRWTLLQAGGWVRGIHAVDPGLRDWSEFAGLAAAQAGAVRHRIEELARFYLSRLWDDEREEWLAYPEEPSADLLEAVYLRGFPGWSTRTFLEDVRRRQRIGPGAWRDLQMTVLRFLRLEPGLPSQPTEF